MSNLARVRTIWSGTPVVGGGVSTFYFNEAHSGFVADLGAFWTALVTRIPAGVQLTTENTGDLVDVETGVLTGTWTDGSTQVVTTTGVGAYAGGVGARIRWQTNGIRNQRRVRGSTFICPLTTTQFDSDGTLLTAFITSLGSAVGALFTASEGNLRVYSRPRAGSGGAAHAVLNYTTPDKVSWLRSRRT